MHLGRSLGMTGVKKARNPIVKALYKQNSVPHAVRCGVGLAPWCLDSGTRNSFSELTGAPEVNSKNWHVYEIIPSMRN